MGDPLWVYQLSSSQYTACTKSVTCIVSKIVLHSDHSYDPIWCILSCMDGMYKQGDKPVL